MRRRRRTRGRSRHARYSRVTTGTAFNVQATPASAGRYQTLSAIKPPICFASPLNISQLNLFWEDSWYCLACPLQLSFVSLSSTTPFPGASMYDRSATPACSTIHQDRPACAAIIRTSSMYRLLTPNWEPSRGLWAVGLWAPQTLIH